jgi:hypothetical protein
VKDALSVLERIRNASAIVDVEAKCEMCAQPIGPEGGRGHSHIVDTSARNLLCVCRPCALLFDRPAAGGGHYRLVPDRWVRVDGFSSEHPAWAGLQIPVGLVFVLRSSAAGGAIAFYPGPAGATESLLALDAWVEMAAEHPELAAMEEDVEAALVLGPRECFVVPIDTCYELVGRLRQVWRGFDGGAEARQVLDAFATRVRDRAGAGG